MMELFLYGEHAQAGALARITGARHRWKRALLPGYALVDGKAVRSSDGSIPGIVADVTNEDIVKLDLVFGRRAVERVHCGMRLVQAFVYVDENPEGKRNVLRRQHDSFLRMEP